LLTLVIENKNWTALRGLKALAEKAVDASLLARDRKKNVTVLFADDATLKILNRDWRGKNKPTNVLSFPAAPVLKLPRGEAKPLGDIALAYETIVREAEKCGKTPKAHTAHLIVHGVLHLLGYDHLNDADAKIMEAREIRILKKLGVADPYQVNAVL
jgi:probable rRNA maturation factor